MGVQIIEFYFHKIDKIKVAGVSNPLYKYISAGCRLYRCNRLNEWV